MKIPGQEYIFQFANVIALKNFKMQFHYKIILGIGEN